MTQHKRIFFKGISFSYLYIFVYLITGVLTTPMLLNHFKADYFALLMLVYAIITYLNNIRFGIPESLGALLAKSKDKALNIAMIKKNFLILILIVFFTLLLFFITKLFISDWRILLGDVYMLNKENVINVFYILIVFALLKIPLDLSLSVFIGFHEVYIEKIYRVINLLVNFMLVLFVVYNAESIVFFAFFAGFFDLIVSVVAFIHIIIRYDLLKESYTGNKITSIEILHGGMLFFQLSMTQTIIWGAGIFFVTHMLSLQDVAVYSLTMKIYIYIFYAYVIINSVIAPLYGKYYSEKSWNDIRKVFNFMIILLPYIGGLIWLGTLYFMSDVIALWTGSENFFIGNIFILFMGSFFYFTGYVNSFITLLYSIGEIKSIIHIRWNEVVVNLIVSFLATYFFGLVGIAIGVSLAIIIISVRHIPKYLESKTNGEISLDFTIQKKHFIFVLIPNIIVAFTVASFVESLLIKLTIFIVMTIIYILSSWNILNNEDKKYIISTFNYRKGIVEK